VPRSLRIHLSLEHLQDDRTRAVHHIACDLRARARRISKSEVRGYQAALRWEGDCTRSQGNARGYTPDACAQRDADYRGRSRLPKRRIVLQESGALRATA